MRKNFRVFVGKKILNATLLEYSQAAMRSVRNKMEIEMSKYYTDILTRIWIIKSFSLIAGKSFLKMCSNLREQEFYHLFKKVTSDR